MQAPNQFDHMLHFVSRRTLPPKFAHFITVMDSTVVNSGGVFETNFRGKKSLITITAANINNFLAGMKTF